MNFKKHSHADAVNIVPADHQRQIANCIRAMVTPIRRGAAPHIRAEFDAQLAMEGWSGEVSVSPQESGLTITSKNGKTGLCLQTGGNFSRTYADLVKLQAMYLNDDIKCGIFVLPSSPAAKALGDNLAQADRLIRELVIFKKVITIPLLVCSLEP